MVSRGKSKISIKCKKYYAKHREEIIRKNVAYAKEHKTEVNIRLKKYRKELRLKVIIGYGGKCSCCGEYRTEFLSVDHVNGGGNKERRKSPSFYTLCRTIIKNNYPSDYRVLCHNCNQSLGFYGYCPHQKEK